MSRIWTMMDVGKRSMQNSQLGLQTVSHNIANRNTEGFSRQRVDFKAAEPLSFGHNRIGQGAKPGDVGRTNNSYIEKQLEREGNQLGYLGARAELMARVEEVYNEQATKGLNQYVSDMFNAFRELSNNPESLASRTMVKETADFLAKDFQRVDRQLNDIQNDVDFRLATKVEELNQIVKEVSQMNEKVQTIEMAGGKANDERDRRDLLVKKLGEIANIRYAEGDAGQLTITAGNNAVLVSGGSYRNLYVQSTPEAENKGEGKLEIFYKSNDDSTPVNVTRQLTGGAIGGLLNVRDDVCNNLHKKMDEMAYNLAWQVNDAHMEGVDRYNQKGQAIFATPTGMKGAASNIKLNDNIKTDVNRIAAGATANAPGDNRIANVLSALQYKQTMTDSTATFDEFYASVVGKVGVDAQRATSAESSQKDLYKQLHNLRESVSGVSLDEETTKMIEYQKSFDASARLIRTADEMMDTVLNLKRL